MKIKKILVCLMPSILLLTGCGRNAGGGNTGSGLIKEDTKITFTSTAGKNNLEIIKKYVESFKKIEPKVTVDVTTVSGSYSQIASNIVDGFSTGNYADLALVYPDAVADFIDYGKAFDVTPYYENKEYGWKADVKADIIDTFLKEGQGYTIEGTYSLPFSKSTEVVYYNREVILGLELGKTVNNGNPINEKYLSDLTWEEFFDVLCPAIIDYTNTEKGKNLIDKTGAKGWSILSYDSDANLFITLAEQYGYDYTSVKNGKGSADFVNDGMKALLKKFNEYAKKNYINSQKSTGERANTFFTNNQALFSVGSTGGASYQISDSNPMEVGVFKLPHAKDGKAASILQGPSCAFLQHNKKDGSIDENRKLASWLFYKHMSNFDNALTWAVETNYLPIYSSAYETEEYKEVYDISKESNLKTLTALNCRIATLVPTIKTEYYTSPAFKGSNACRDQVEALMGKALNSTNTATDENIKTWFNDAYTAAQKAIK